jgi:hypothetical protein
MHETKPTTKSRSTKTEENQSFHAAGFVPTASDIFRTKIELQNEDCIDIHEESVRFYQPPF